MAYSNRCFIPIKADLWHQILASEPVEEEEAGSRDSVLVTDGDCEIG